MKIRDARNHTIDSLFPVVLFFTFAIMALLVMLFSASSYEKIQDDSLKSNSCGTAISYVTEKIHAGDKSGCISVGEFDGCDALIIKESVDSEYVTYIYEFNGKLKELFTQPNANATAKSGTDIVDIAEFDITQTEDGIISMLCMGNDGKTQTAYVDVRSD